MAEGKTKSRKAGKGGRSKLWRLHQREVVTLRELHGPFDIVGDVHGCLDELLELLAALNYRVERQGAEFVVHPPAGRTLAFLGDFVDRGPSVPAVLRLVMGMVHAGTALCVAGNRDVEMARLLKGRPAKITRGMVRTLDQFVAESDEFCASALRFLHRLPSHLLLDSGRLVLAHAGLKETLQGRLSAAARAFALHGELTGKRDDAGRLIRKNWAADYRGAPLVVYGHTPVPEPFWLNNTVNIDTGCVYGGHLTALRYPERETLSIPAKIVYYTPRRIFPPNPAIKPRVN